MSEKYYINLSTKLVLEYANLDKVATRLFTGLMIAIVFHDENIKDLEFSYSVALQMRSGRSTYCLN